MEGRGKRKNQTVLAQLLRLRVFFHTLPLFYSHDIGNPT